MFGRKITLLLRACALLVGLLALPGCVVYEGEYRVSRGVPLSKAMEASAGGGGEPLRSTPSYEPTTTIGIAPDVAVESSTGSGEREPMVSYDRRSYGWQIQLDAAYSIPFSGDIAGITWFSIAPFCIETESESWGLFLGGGTVDLKAGSLPERAVRDTWTGAAGLVYRRYLTGAHTFVSPYVTASVAYQLLHWRYRNPVVVDSDTVRSDGLHGLGGNVGFGITITRKTNLSIFGEVGIGGTAFLGNSFEGFSNDVFDNYGCFSVKAGMSVKF